MKTATAFLILHLASLCTRAAGADDNNLKQTCIPVSCTTVFDGPGGSSFKFTRFWMYDDFGRLIVDSINAADSLAWNGGSEHFLYTGDSMIRINPIQGTMVIKILKNNLPVSSTQPYGVKNLATYNADGTLQQVQCTKPFINRDGFYALDTSTIDSIVYEEGNIVAYRFRSPWQKIYSHFSLTYYPDKFYETQYNNGYRQLAISFDFNGGCQLNTAPYSKNLLKTVTSNYDGMASYTYNYLYTYDNQDMLTEETVTPSNTGAPAQESYGYHYFYKYACK